MSYVQVRLRAVFFGPLIDRMRAVSSKHHTESCYLTSAAAKLFENMEGCNQQLRLCTDSDLRRPVPRRVGRTVGKRVMALHVGMTHTVSMRRLIGPGPERQALDAKAARGLWLSLADGARQRPEPFTQSN